MIVTDDILHGNMIARAAKCSYNPATDNVIANTSADGKLLGGVIYQDFTGVCFICHIAGFHPNWMTRDFLWCIFDYPFVQCGARKIVVHISEANTKSLEFVKNLGFNEEYRVKDVFPEGASVIMSMYREKCRWLKIKPRGWTQGQQKVAARG